MRCKMLFSEKVSIFRNVELQHDSPARTFNTHISIPVSHPHTCTDGLSVKSSASVSLYMSVIMYSLETLH